MVAQATLVEDLQAIVGEEHAFPHEDGQFEVDGLNPRAVVEPGSYEDVAAVMRFASQHELAVIPGIPSSLMVATNVPGGYDVALSLERLDQIIEYEPADLTVTCQAGMTVEDLQRRLGENGQMVPFGSLVPAPYTVGSLVAANFSMLRLAHGSPRDFTIGLRVVTADGRITRAGGKVVKNVAGYDLCKLYIGSLGTLGIIVEATFKLFPVPETTERLELQFRRARDGCDFASDLYRRGLSLWELDMRRPTGGDPVDSYVLRIDLAGSVAAVERSLGEISDLASARGVHRYQPTEAPDAPPTATAWEQLDALTCRVSVLPSSVPDLIEALDRDAPGADVWSASPIFGTVSATWLDGGRDDDLVLRLRSAAAKLGGTLAVIRGSPELKRQIDVFGDPPPSFELMRRVKQQFDPKGILSPGRFVGRL